MICAQCAQDIDDFDECLCGRCYACAGCPNPGTPHLRNVYGPADIYEDAPEGTTVGATYQFVGFSIGFNRQHLPLPDEADKIAALLCEAAAKCRTITEAKNRRHLTERTVLIRLTPQLQPKGRT
jgi:hypothetical protein